MVFAFRYQPVKTLYTIVGVLWILVRLPFWVVRNLIPSWRPRRGWSFGRAIVVELSNSAVVIMRNAFPPPPQSFDKLAQTPGFVWVEPLRNEHIVGEIKKFAELNDVKAERVGGFWFTSEGDHTPPKEAKQGERILYYLHGGGFVMGSASPSSGLTDTTVKGLLEYASSSGFTRVFASEYCLCAGPPLPVLNPFLACTIDVLAGYFYLIHNLHYSPENIVVVGDSAGGVLAYQLARYCTAYHNIAGIAESFPVPGGVLLLSPSVDSGLHPLPDTSMVTNRRSEYIRTWLEARYPVSALKGKGLKESDVDRPWLSPGSTQYPDDDEDIKGTFTHFPKTMIVTGEAEMTRDCNHVLRDRMEREMGKSKLLYVEVQDAPHDILMATLWEPERMLALKEIQKWIQTL
ncbi:alpha/beta-hydrolase [Marasmius fiardii PR-910]|nr:alpha/beta-hydrolase [Marasmius fiardii PR-910]